MTTAKLKKRASPISTAVTKAPPQRPSLQPRSTLAEHVHRIGILGKRIEAYIHFMSKVGELSGLSDEMKTRAAIAFAEKLIEVERQLGHIHDAYQLE